MGRCHWTGYVKKPFNNVLIEKYLYHLLMTYERYFGGANKFKSVNLISVNFVNKKEDKDFCT